VKPRASPVLWIVFTLIAVWILAIALGRSVHSPNPPQEITEGTPSK